MSPGAVSIAITTYDGNRSLRSAIEGALANYSAPSVKLPFAGALVASLFGRPVRDAAANSLVLLRGDERRGNVGAI